MTDRVPGAPGQYTMTVSASEAQKLLTGEAVTVTLVRNDQPLVEGTPYNKASVLPDDLALILCPSASDPTPADALRGCLPKTGGAMTGTLNMNNQALTGLREPSADTDAATLKTLKDRGAQLLWSNSSPTAEFAGQDIAIANLSNYKLCLVEAAFTTSDDQVTTQMFSVNSDTFVIGESGSDTAAFRTFKPSSGKITVSDGYYGTTVTNTILIPLRIYGIF